jgi:hypothetical protein
MKLKPNYLLLFIAITGLFACKKDAEAPKFDATIQTASPKAGSPVKFSINGNPDYIAFYSGEAGKEYQHRNRTMSKGSSQYLQFTSVATGGQTGNVKLMASKNFNGNYDAAGIAAATWTDISSRAVLSTGASASSGQVSLTDFNTDDKPVYIAFYYQSPVNAQKPRTWSITALTINNVLISKEGTTTTSVVAGNFGVAGNFANAGFRGVSLQNNTYNWVSSATALNMTGGPIAEPLNEDWAISAPIQLNSVMPDLALGIKAPDSPILNEYSYTFANAGTYTVTFVGKNSTIDGTREIIKHLTVTVAP